LRVWEKAGLLLLGIAFCGAGAAVHPGETVRLGLADGTPVALIRLEAAEGAAHEYRYLPANLTIARRRDGPLEFSFLPYKRDEGGEIEGGIMHLLLRWGLSEKQEAELQEVLRSKVDSLGTVAGAASVRPRQEGTSLEITSRGAIGSILNRALASAGHVPAVPGSKLAMSFRFDSHDAVRMSEALRSKRGPWGDKIRFWFTVDSPSGEVPDWVLESDLGTLIPRTGG